MMIRQSTHCEEMQKHCAYCMHKVHRSYKNMTQRSDEVVVAEVK
jgi:hypothetical protein